MPSVPRAGPGEAVRIVLDTNVVLSALLWRGTPYRLFEVLRQREVAGLFASRRTAPQLAAARAGAASPLSFTSSAAAGCA